MPTLGKRSRAGRSTRTPGSAFAKTRSFALTDRRGFTASFISRTAPSECCRWTGMERSGWSGNIAIRLTRIPGKYPKEDHPRLNRRRKRQGGELREETGLVAGRLELVATSHLSNSVCDEVGYVFRATELSEGADDQEGTERIVVRRVKWEEALRMVKAGEITDSLSVIAILHEAVRRLEGAC